MEENESKRLVKGALLLTFAGIISKILSATYRIPLQNLTGDFGFYIYQQVYPLIGMVMILSLYGYPAAVSRITAEMKQEKLNNQLRYIHGPLLLLLFIINGILFITVFLSASFLSSLVGDSNLKQSYEIIAYTFLLIPLLSLFRGFFQGNGEMKATAYSQVAEQIIRVVIIIVVAYFVYAYGVDIYQIGNFGALASVSGMVVAIILLSILFLRENTMIQGKDEFSIPWSYYMKTLFMFGIVACSIHLVLIIVQFADVLTLVPNLIQYGLSPINAMEAKGVFDRGQPLIQLGIVFGSSFALALIPAISKEKLQRNRIVVYQSIIDVIKYSVYIASAATIGLVIIMPEVNMLLFKNMAGTGSLRVLVLSILLSSVAITASAVLQSLGYIKRVAVFIIVVFIIKYLLNELLVPYWGIYGAATATVGSLLALCILVLYELKRNLPNLRLLNEMNGKALIFANGSMAASLLLAKYLFAFIPISSRVGMLFYILLIVMLGSSVYFIFLLRFKAFTERQLKIFPFSNAIFSLQKLLFIRDKRE